MKNLSTTLACHATFFYFMFDHIRKITGKSLTFFVTCSILSRNSWFHLSEHCSQLEFKGVYFLWEKNWKEKRYRINLSIWSHKQRLHKTTPVIGGCKNFVQSLLAKKLIERKYSKPCIEYSILLQSNITLGLNTYQ